MFAKRLIQLLSLCLVFVIGLFLYSEYGVNQSVVHTAVPAGTSPAVAAEPTAAIADNETADNQSVDTVIEQPDQEQPDKAIPIPAHKIKKILADPVDDVELQEKIESANQAITELDKKLNSSSTTQVEPDEVEADEDLQKRIEHIRQHLEQDSEY